MGTDPDQNFPVRILRHGGIKMLSIHTDLAIPVCLQPLIPAYLEPFGREHKERFPILLE